ncbi:MAG TPA: ABC transporter permease subunit [Leptospiraceae bacterium]|nr:ABC transporter permease subunit [Leptospiraceae bacterium]HMW05436.1 ABC transporter permease subunit [Leptospiraceae bacterium]HMX31415.1 ABC transporter permease subunit [Leptospiraceae bacterium]HMY30946.1 ABC transporter permease subunit [Leptospiraceae bacterium]HNA05586.1 ABC transporter permease subunit [Leptospiraceae bacterium]
MVFLKIIFSVSILIGMLFFPAPVKVDLTLSGFPPFENWMHPLGCDQLGRDIYALYAYGTFTTFLISIPARIITLFLSVMVSFLSYVSGRYSNLLLESISSVFLSLPSFLVAIIVLYSLGPELVVFYIAIFLSDWAFAFESIQAKVREVKQSGYVIAARIMGGGNFYLYRTHILPEISSLLYILFITGIPSVIMTVALFSYMGIDFGTDFLGPGLGEQIAFSKDYFLKSPLALFTPIIAILFLVLSFSKKRK